MTGSETPSRTSSSASDRYGARIRLTRKPGWLRHGKGSLPICLAFVITDPTTSSLSKEGRWAHGLLFALFVVAIRVLDPTHPEGSLFAVLLATLAVPLIDYFAVRRHVARAEGQLELRT